MTEWFSAVYCILSVHSSFYKNGQYCGMPTPTPGGMGSFTARGCFIYTPAAEEKQVETPYETVR